MDGEEVGLVLQLGNQRELVLDQFARPRRRPCRPAPAGTFFRQCPQPGRRRLPIGHQLVRVGIAQLVEGEAATLGDAQGFGQKVGWIDRRQRFARAQVPLPVGEQPPAGFGDGDVMADRGQRVLQRPSSPNVHVHVSRSHQRQRMARRECAQLGEARSVVGVAV